MEIPLKVSSPRTIGRAGCYNANERYGGHFFSNENSRCTNQCKVIFAPLLLSLEAMSTSLSLDLENKRDQFLDLATSVRSYMIATQMKFKNISS